MYTYMHLYVTVVCIFVHLPSVLQSPPWPHMFTHRFCICREVIDGIAEVCYIAGPMLFFDLIMVLYHSILLLCTCASTMHNIGQVTASGVLKGLGQQLVGAITNFASYYLIGIPMAIYLALYRGLGLMGVWTGLAVADFLQVCVKHV